MASDERLEAEMTEADITYPFVKWPSPIRPQIETPKHRQDRRNTVQTMRRRGRNSRASVAMVPSPLGEPLSPPSKKLMH